ncbi:MAG: DNA polymerase IV [Epsilonproteobacteria bacterium]|nr:DNA polymerase IV [Campylobacterota bacterium]
MKIHLDLDCFFVSCERLLYPDLRNRPVAVGGRGDPFIFDTGTRAVQTTANNEGAFVPSVFYNAKTDFSAYFVEQGRIRGIVMTSSYEARAYGVKTGMSVREALGLCPRLIVRAPNHLFYHERSHALKEWLQTRIPVLEQYSIDEFFGDLSGWVADKDVPRFCQTLKQEIEKELGLPVSIGSAPSKWIAKLATSAAKPGRGEGVKVLFRHEVDNFVNPLPIEAFPGIGRGFSRRLKAYKIETLGELKQARHLLYRWKKPGIQLYHRVNGDDNEPVIPKRDRRSIGISRTVDPLYDRAQIRRRLTVLCRHLAHLVQNLGVTPQTLYLGIKYQFGQKRARHVTEPFLFSEKALRQRVLALFEKLDIYKNLAVIRLGISCGHFAKRPAVPADLFAYEEEKKAQKLWRQMALLQKKYGIDTIRTAAEFL